MSNQVVRERYRELRCSACRKLICLEYIFDGYIKFICPRCGEDNVFHFKHRRAAKNAIVKPGEQSNINNA